jgi:hypothetical protein
MNKYSVVDEHTKHQPKLILTIIPSRMLATHKSRSQQNLPPEHEAAMGVCLWEKLLHKGPIHVEDKPKTLGPVLPASAAREERKGAHEVLLLLLPSLLAACWPRTRPSIHRPTMQLPLSNSMLRIRLTCSPTNKNSNRSKLLYH